MASEHIAWIEYVAGAVMIAIDLGLLFLYPEATRAGAFWPWYLATVTVIGVLVVWYDRALQWEARRRKKLHP